MARQEGTSFFEKARQTLTMLSGQAAFSLIILHKGKLIAARDPFGFRPLSIAKRGEDGDYEWAVASETCAFHDRFDWVGDVEAGQMVTIDGDRLGTVSFAEPDPRPCILSRRTSMTFGRAWGRRS
jgi:amidophosphoribosyltransferase